MINIRINNNIFILEDVNLKEALAIKEEFESAPNMKKRQFLLYKNYIGYYAGWDCINNNSIYCGTRSESESIKQINEYLTKLNIKNEI
jgi:hypothetical protein